MSEGRQMNERWVVAQMPRKVSFLAEPHPYKILYGGRGGIKSWSIARQLIIDAANRPLKILCCREMMNSIADSVHALLEAQINMLRLTALFDVQKSVIYGVSGSQFAFAGLKHNATGIKSYEGFDRAWVEEAHNVSRASWKILIPTIRKEGAEIWVSFNPELESDDTYQRFVLNPPPGAVVVKTSYRDNRWLSEKFKSDMEHLKETAPDEFENVYEGSPKSTLEGAVFAEELRLVDRESRITRIPYDPTRPVDTYWDLGIGDATAIWFAQSFPFEYRLIDYEEGSGHKLGHYLQQLQSRGYVYGRHHLPHDAKARELGTGKSIEELMRLQGFNVIVVPKLSITDSINAARTIFGQCWFDAEKCHEGIHALRHYIWPKNTKGIPGREPEHNWASHGSSAFRYLGVSARPPERELPPPPPQQQYFGADSWMG
jgi:phage terminase large subunit